MPTLHIKVLNTLVPKSLEPNKLPLWQSVTKHNLKAQSLQRKALYQKKKKNAHYNKSNPNYYPSVASVDNSSIKSTCIFPETLNKMHKHMCGHVWKIQVNKMNS